MRFSRFLEKRGVTKGVTNHPETGDKDMTRAFNPASNRPITSDLSLEWQVTSAANAVNERYIGVRVAGLITILGVELYAAVMQYSIEAHSTIIAVLLIYILITDPFLAVAAELSRPTRLIASVTITMIAITVWIPHWQMGLTSFVFLLMTLYSIRPSVNKRWLIKQNIEVSDEVSNLLNSTDNRRAGEQWQADGRRHMLALGAIIGAIPRTQADMEAWRICYFGGYEVAEKSTTKMKQRIRTLEIALSVYKETEAENKILHERIDEMESEKGLAVKHAETVLQHQINDLNKIIRILRETNDELVKALPENIVEERKEILISEAKEQGLSNKQIADILGVSVRTVQRRFKEEKESA